MPRGDFNVHFDSRGGGFYVEPEEAAGVAFLVIILIVLLIIGCWYYRRRSGYRSIQNQRGPMWRSGQYSETGAPGEDKVSLAEFSSLRHVAPTAPPAYDKISTLPPPYTP